MEQSRRILAKARIDGPIDGLLTEVILIPEIIGKCFLDRKKKCSKLCDLYFTMTAIKSPPLLTLLIQTRDILIPPELQFKSGAGGGGTGSTIPNPYYPDPQGNSQVYVS